MADHDGDGILDIVSGSYDPGDVYLLRGLGKGRYAAATPILDRAGVPLAHHPDELRRFRALPEAEQDSDAAIQLRIASFGSWPALVDWDADGDPDMVIGSFDGGLYLRTNVAAGGRGRPPEWAPEAVRIEADGKAMAVGGHAAPAAADWDGDGLFDLVVGAADGSVVWFENLGEPGRPRFGASAPLVPRRSQDKFVQYFVSGGELPPPGTRAQIAVVDHDLDGKLDLLVGDYAQVTPLRALDASERAAFEELTAQRATALARWRTSDDEAARKVASDDCEAIEAKMQAYLAKPAGDRGVRSWVWLYRRVD